MLEQVSLNSTTSLRVQQQYLDVLRILFKAMLKYCQKVYNLLESVQRNCGKLYT